MELNNVNEDMLLQGFDCKWKVETGRVDTKSRGNTNFVCNIYDTVRGYTVLVIRFMGGGGECF